jgi:hypothetical protein
VSNHLENCIIDVFLCILFVFTIFGVMNYLVFFILQNTLNQLERDCDNIGAKVNLAIAEDNTSRSHNMWAWTKGLGYLFAG